MKQVGQFLRAVILFALDMRPLSFYPTFAAPRIPYVIGHFRELSFLSCLSTTPHPKGAGEFVGILVGYRDFCIAV